MIGAILATVLAGFAPSSTTVAGDVAVAHTALAARPRFSYDRSRPLSPKLGQLQANDGVLRQALSFDAGRGRRSRVLDTSRRERAVACGALVAGLRRNCHDAAARRGPARAARDRVVDDRPTG